MAKSTQSTLRSSRLQMVPGEGMASAGLGQRGQERRESPVNMLPSPPFASSALPAPRNAGRSLADRARGLDLGWQE